VYGNEKDKDARQAKDAFRYINIKQEIHSTSAAISFNKMCKTHHLRPKFVITVTQCYKSGVNNVVGFYTNYKTVTFVHSYMPTEQASLNIQVTSDLWVCIHKQYF
jgi:hypothetical protein